MDYLVDTHIFLWWLAKDPKLDVSVRSIIENRSHRIYVSVVSAWEISIKLKSGKLPLKTTLENAFAEPGFEILPLTINHVFELHKLPPIHKDPFDRMIIAQAKTEKLTLITRDEKFIKYRVSIFS